MGSLGTTEEGRALLQDRLAVFGKWIFLMVVAIGVTVTAITLVFVDAEPPSGWVGGSPYDLVYHLVPLAMWLGMRRGTWPINALYCVDAGAMAIYGAGMALSCTYTREMGMPLAAAVFGAVTFSITRAIVVPSPWWRTLWISMLCVVPVAVAAGWLTARDLEVSEYQRQAAYIDTFCYGALGIIVATVASRIIFGLRRDAGRARQLGQYRLDEKIGEGGMGVVYRASHAMLRRPTAIKLLHLASERNLERFAREVQLTAQLTHPNTVSVYDYGRTPDGVFYYAMELLDGIDLEQLVKREGRIPPGRVIHILRQVADALSEAHGIGLIHRDIKPANIILCWRGGRPDFVKVVDFGLVKDLQAGQRSLELSTDNAVIGTPLYLSPEAISEPDAADGRSDLYAVGATGYYLLTGEPVFEGNSMVEVCSHHLHTEPTRPSERVGAELPTDLEEVLLRCLAKHPDHRYAVAAELVSALDECADANSWRRDDARGWWEAFRAAGGERREHVGSTSRIPDTVAISLDDRALEIEAGEAFGRSAKRARRQGGPRSAGSLSRE